jgi:hypothetical protein
MTPDTLLRWVVRLLPARRREWGLAMQAELAGLERGRWGFALSCTRGVLGRPETMLRLMPRLLAVESIGVWLVGCLLAAALSVAVRASGHANVTCPG